MQLGLLRQYNPQTDDTYTPIYNNRRFSHTWVLGKSGVGKTTALVRWALDDITNGEGLAFFDPHGDAINEILLHTIPARRKDVVLYDSSDFDFPIAFNILSNVREYRKPFVASAVVDCFKSIWRDSWGVQLEMFVYAGARALLDVPDGTLMGLKFLLTSPSFRKRVLSYTKDPAIKDFWKTDFETHMPEREQREGTLSTLNKIGAFISDPTIRNSIGQSRTAIDLKDIIDNRKILLVNLPQGQLGIEKSRLIGALFMSHLHLTALSRTINRTPFHIYADECHNFGNTTLIEMLSGIRKFNISLVLAHQYLDQLDKAFFSALIGTVGTMLSFRLGIRDADFLSEEFYLTRNDFMLHELDPYTAHMRSNGNSYPLVMPTLDHKPYPSSPRRIRNRCRSQFATPRAVVERRITRFIANTS